MRIVNDKKTILLTLVLALSLPLLSQQLYAYQDLSYIYYKKLKDSIRKNWICPLISGTKATQEKYKEIWDARTNFLLNAIDANDFVHDAEIDTYVSGIIRDLAIKNPKHIPVLPLLLIDRSDKVNAYSIGSNILIVNAGMIAFCRSREELSLAIAHELSHEYLNHSLNAMKESAILLTSDVYKKSLDAVLESEYQRLTKLKKIITDYSFSRNRHNRYRESEADSLAVTMLKNSNIGFDPVFFLRLDSADMQQMIRLKAPVKNYFLYNNLSVEDSWFQKRSKGLSSRNYSFKDTTVNFDSLKTHPDCIERYARYKTFSTLAVKPNIVPIIIKEKATKIVLWNMFNDLRLAACLYRIMQEKDNLINDDPWYDFMIYNIISGLNYQSIKLNRFNAIGIRIKEEVSADYVELQTMLEQIPAERLEILCTQAAEQPFWNRLPPECRQLKLLLNSLKAEDKDINKRIAKAAKDFTDNYPTSMYCEFADHFK